MNIREEFLKIQLKEMIQEESVKLGEFELQSGQKSNVFINLKPLLHNQCFLYILTSLIKDYIEELRLVYNVKINGIGGPGYGALPMASATIIRLIEVDDVCVNNMYSFSIRNEKKDHGVYNQLDGPINNNDIVMIIDDVITTGENIMKSINTCYDNNLRPIAIFSIVNRENLSLQEITNSVFYSKNLFTLKDLIDDY
jgi:orotate phosphoribosyltransferase